MKGPKPRDPVERLIEKIDFTGDCWLWLGATNGVGYGKMMGKNRKEVIYTHRFAYETAVGPIPDGLVIDHLCCVRNCCNPDHLEPVTQQENLYRGHVRRGTARAFRPHGTTARYSAGCICADCRAAHAERHMAWRKKTGR